VIFDSDPATSSNSNTLQVPNLAEIRHQVTDFCADDVPTDGFVVNIAPSDGFL
jgi:hypothetical protein